MKFLYLFIFISLVNISSLALELFPEDTNSWLDNSGNVTQGIAKYREGYWITQDAGRKAILFNWLSEDGVSLGNWQINKDSHGADLSFLENEKEIVFITDSSDKEHRGLGLYSFNKDRFQMSFVKDIKLFENRIHITPSLNEKKDLLLVRALSKTNNQDDRIYTYSTKEILKNNIKYQRQFLLNQDQTQEGQWFQGLLSFADHIYCLTGNDQINDQKLLYKYDMSGKLLEKYKIDLKKIINYRRGHLYELEGLTVVNDEIVTVLNSGRKGKRKKSLLKL